jgi:hypothetical protein
VTGDDQNLGPFPIGFTFPLYGTDFTQMRICSNGWISPTSTSTAYNNTAIPAVAEPNNLIAPLWDDMYPPGGGTIYYYYDAANSRFIVEWDNIMSYASPRTPQKYEAILYPNGQIDFMYHTIQAPCLNTSTVGKENGTGTVAVQCTFDGSGPLEPASNTGIRIFGAPPTGPVDVTLTAVNPPIIIPATGGTFQYRANIRNLTTSAQTFQIWTKWLNPVGTWVNLLGPLPITLPGNANVTRRRFQNVAGSNPPGTYTFVGYAGTGTTIHDSSFFTFTKSATDMGGEWVYNNDNWGEDFDMEIEATPSQFELLGNFPNPFNPTTTIRFSLATAGQVHLTVYDLAGREVAALVDGYRTAGMQEVSFDATALPSGVYMYRLSANGQTAISKMVLMK